MFRYVPFLFLIDDHFYSMIVSFFNRACGFAINEPRGDPSTKQKLNGNGKNIRHELIEILFG